MLKNILTVLVMAVILGLLSLGVNFWVYHELQRRLDIRFEGKYRPALFIPSFTLERGVFSWKDRVELLEGNFKVTFDPLTLVSHQGLRIIVESRGIKIRLLGSWALQQGIEEATVDLLVADVVLGRRGLSGINEVEVVSKSFQFSLKNADSSLRPKSGVL